MKKAVLRDPHRFHLVETEAPEIKDDEALLKVRDCGIGGSDLRVFTGNNQFSRSPTCPAASSWASSGRRERAHGSSPARVGARCIETTSPQRSP